VSEPSEPAGFFAAAPDAPQELRPVVVLLVLNLAISITLTVATLLTRHSIVNYQLDHRHITDPAQRRTLRDSYTAGIVTRAVANVVVSIVYAFLVRALFRGRRWAYRRVVLIACIGILGLLILQFSPYPTWMRIEQLLQAIILAALLACVLRPAVRAHFATGLPGRDQRRFRK
jgi:MFS family permease